MGRIKLAIILAFGLGLLLGGVFIGKSSGPVMVQAAVAAEEPVRIFSQFQVEDNRGFTSIDVYPVYNQDAERSFAGYRYEGNYTGNVGDHLSVVDGKLILSDASDRFLQRFSVEDIVVEHEGYDVTASCNGVFVFRRDRFYNTDWWTPEQ